MQLRGFFCVAALCLGAVGIGFSAPVHADVPDEVLRQLGLRQFATGTERDTAALQTDLAWLGLYQDKIDGQSNRSTREAIRIFLESIDKPPRRTLSDEDRAVLRGRAAATIRDAGFRQTNFEWAGISARLPSNFLRRPQVFGRDYTHIGISGRGSAGISVEFYRYEFDSATRPSSWLQAIADAHEDDEGELDELNRGVVQQTVFLSHRQDGQIQHDVHEISGNRIRGISISYEETSQYAIQPILAEILGSLDLYAGNAVPMSQISSRIRSGDYPGGRDFPDWYRSARGTGSGSIVSYDGHILTNQHVVAGCGRITVNGREAMLLGSDIRLDLALVRAPVFANRTPVKFRRDSAVLGEPIYVMGFPVFDVSQSINITDGIVSSTVGLKGDRTHVQITAPVQPGNSGGPVLDRHGAQIAVVVTKVAASFGIQRNIENIAWVIRSSEAIGFMERFGISPITTTRSDAGLAPLEDRVSDWRQRTVRLECHDD